MSRYFTSDLHLGHHKDFLYKQRGFDSVQEHDAAIVYNINADVKEDDELYVIGDIIMYEPDNIELFKQINCKNIHIICGNHDSDNKIGLYKQCENVKSINFGERLKLGKIVVYLSHFPMLLTDRNFYCLCGHFHTSDKFKHIDINCLHIELDAWKLRPVSEEEIIDILKYQEKLKEMSENQDSLEAMKNLDKVGGN